MRKRLQAALDWLRGFLEGMMSAPAYSEADFRRQVRGESRGDERSLEPDRQREMGASNHNQGERR